VAIEDPIIVIGYSPHYSWQLDRVVDDMEKLGWDNLRDQMLDREFEVYDMSTLPEKGDALDAITPNTPLIVALHLYGMHPSDRYTFYPAGYMYNQGNYKIYLLAYEWNIPLMVLGDQPEWDRPVWGEKTFTQQYFTERAD